MSEVKNFIHAVYTGVVAGSGIAYNWEIALIVAVVLGAIITLKVYLEEW